MPYRVVNGTVSIDGKSPDGDTIAFTIDNNKDWLWPGTINGRFPNFNSKYQANIRFEAIDALELHYMIQFVYPGVIVRQPIKLALEARNKLIDLLGFDRSVITESENYRISDPMNQKMPITLAYNGIDPFGRIIGFVFKGEWGLEVSDRNPTIRLSAEDVVQSINSQLLSEGLVYPTFYKGLYPQLRNALSDVARDARSQGVGVWKHHKNDFVFARKPVLQDIESLVMMPKLFRRLAKHIARNGAISNFRHFLSESSDLTVDTRDIRLSNFSSFVRTKRIDDDTYKLYMNHQPEELIFFGG